MNPEHWYDEHKATMPQDIAEKFEQLRMYLRGWLLYEEICEPLSKEMIAHSLMNIDDPDKVPLLNETLTACANYYIMVLCSDVEALIRNSMENISTEFIEEKIKAKNKYLDEALNQESFAGSKVMLAETIDILQKTFITYRKELLNIESKWWQFYKYSFRFHGMRWQVDAYQIILELRKGKNPNELIHLTHQDEFNAVKELVEVIEDVEREKEK